MSAHSAFSLVGEKALITGGGTGIGKAIAWCLLDAGAKVIIAGRTEAPLRECCEAWGAEAQFLVHDITQCDKAADLLDRSAQLVGDPISILVNNAGIHCKKAALQVTDDDMQQLFQTHVLGAAALTRAAGAAMVAQKHGSILFVSSMAAIFGIPNVLAYATAKSAILGMVRSLAVEWSPHNVRVNAIAPGWVETDMSSRALQNDPERKRRILERTPQHRLGNPQDVGWAAVYLCSPAASFVTGQQLVVDGGASIGF